MSYIYEQHKCMLKINYILPKAFVCTEIETGLCNGKPYDMTNLNVLYSASIYELEYNENEDSINDNNRRFFFANSLDELVEKCRVWAIQVKNMAVIKQTNNTQSSVNKSAIERTDSHDF